MLKGTHDGSKVLICAPYGGDAASVASLLSGRGYDAQIYSDVASIASALGETTGVVLVTEEALAVSLIQLQQALEAQPQWSDIPFVLLAARRVGREHGAEIVRRRLPDHAVNVVLLERPMSSESLLSAIGSALRARQKQFEIRDRIAELDDQRSRLTALLEHLPVGVAFVDAHGETLIANPAYRHFQPTGEIPSRTPDGEERWTGFDEHGEPILRNRFVTVRALAGETVKGIEFQYHPIDSPDVWTRVSGVPLLDAEGRVTGAMSVIVDIDEQKRAQIALANSAQDLETQVAERTEALREALALATREAEERQHAEAALRQAQKMEAVGQLTGGIAHDFNNMLTGVIGSLDIMKRRIASNRLDGLERLMDAAFSSAQRAAGLTARLLAFSRRQSLDSRATDINALVQSLDDLLTRTMSERIDVSIVVTDGIPQGVVDANQLENALLNLAINARDAMPDGGRLTIETGLVTLDEGYISDHPGIVPGRYVTVAVSDTGVGMDALTIEKVFEPFYTTKPVGQGTGLGLSMVYGFAQQSNGQVRIHSTPGIGTSVTIFLPVADSDLQSDDLAEVPTVYEGEGQTVLLVEDDDSVRFLVSEVLQELGYLVVEASEPNAAIKHIETKRRFDMMVTDVGLPGMNGRQLAEIVRGFLPDLPILFVTGYAENATLRAGFLGPNMSMIAKPFQIEALSAKIREMLPER